MCTMSFSSKPLAGSNEDQKSSMCGWKIIVSPPLKLRPSHCVSDSTNAHGPCGLSACSSCTSAKFKFRFEYY